MNTSERIQLITGVTPTDKQIIVKLEQNIDELQFMTLNIYSKDIYQDFNADYGVLVGRVIANGGIGIPNAKISIFIPLTDTDAEISDIASIYPYKTPRDKNSDGKRYNLLPRVAQFEPLSGVYKPKQPFGSFPIKPEIVTNQPFLDVYKKYYKYTALTNQYGDYMIFGVPIGLQTVHLSVDITDIGKYSMTPSSMIKAGYSENLFTEGASAIKPSTDLTDLPNIETQEITVEVVPFWGDSENFIIGITRQDFRVKAVLSSSFYIFGTTMTMGQWGIFGNPGGDNRTHETNYGFYSLDTDVGFYNNLDIRTYRVAQPTIKVFTYTNDIPIVGGNLIVPSDVNVDTQIRELDKTEYYEYNVNGNFLLTIPCNRYKVVTDDLGNETQVDDNSPYGVFSKFFGMILINYPDLNTLTEDSGWSYKYNGGHPQYKARGQMKIPQTFALNEGETGSAGIANNNWRKEYYSFTGGGIYGVAQFFPTKWAAGNKTDAENIDTEHNTENTFGTPVEIDYLAGGWFKVAGSDDVTQTTPYDNQNYLIFSVTGGTPEYQYDFSPNVKVLQTQPAQDKFFGGQWLNFCLMFPCHGWAYGHGTNRNYSWADIFYNNYTSATEYFVRDNTQKLFANLVNSKNMLKGDAFQTAFINVPKSELQKLNSVPLKGINVRRWNNNDEFYKRVPLGLPELSIAPYKYLGPKTAGQTTTGRQYNLYGWDEYYNSYTGSLPAGSPPSAYLFKGMYNNDVIKMLSDLSII
jgi:hypothetical protein